jgi:hypothetical protein
VFAPISVFLFVLFSPAALPNGIQLIEVPGQGTVAEIVAGYASGGLTGFASIEAARSLELTAYAAGGRLEYFSEFERTGLRITVPPWAAPMFANQLPALFKEVPPGGPPPAKAGDFRAQVEEEVRNALLGPPAEPAQYATDRAFVVFPGPIPNSLSEGLAAIPNRTSKNEPESRINRLPAERTLRFKSDLPVAGVVFAAPAPGVYYKEWYSILLLDRVIHRIVPLKVTSELRLTMNPYYYRIEVPVPAGQFPEPTEETLLQELQRLQFTRADPRDLEAARGDVLGYLDSSGVKEWFQSLGFPERRDEGKAWIQAMTADDVRVAARDLLIANRVVATWSARPAQTAVDVEDLSKDAAAGRPSGAASQPSRQIEEGATIALPAFPPHTHSAQSIGLPERLASGVSLVASNVNAVFVSGGMLTKYDREPDAAVANNFQNYRADRILVLATPDALNRARQLWSSFKGNNNANTGVPRGNVSSGDLPVLVLIKALADRKIIEAGWAGEVELKFSANEGSTLVIAADAERRARIIEWINRWGAERPSDMDIAWAREVAIHRLGTIQADLQALTWERDPRGAIQDLLTISAGHVQDVARIYF